jgi:hypothetical protein
MKSLCRALLVLNVLYCVLAVAQDGLPGWHMFEAVERTDYTMTDRDGRAVDVREWLPRGANVVDRQELRRVVRFVCEKERGRAPFTYEEPGGVRVILEVDCRIHVPR